METAITHYAFRMLVLLVCVIAASSGAERTPTREVTELVSVLHKPARIQATSAGKSANAQVPALAPDTSTNRAASAKRVSRGRALHAKAPRQVSAGTRSARKPVAVAKNPSVVRASCRPPTCRAATPATKAVVKRTAARPGKKAEPPLPAVLVPIRTLGLRLQAWLGAQQEAARPSRRPRRK